MHLEVVLNILASNVVDSWCGRRLAKRTLLYHSYMSGDCSRQMSMDHCKKPLTITVGKATGAHSILEGVYGSAQRRLEDRWGTYKEATVTRGA